MEDITQKIIVARRQHIVGLFCDSKPPLSMCENDNETGNQDLQNWIGEHQVKAPYSTNLSIMDAAWEIAASQIGNGMEQIKEESDV